MKTFNIDGKAISFQEGDTLMDAASRAGVYIAHLCHKPGYKPQGSCKLCTVTINGRNASACTFPASEGLEVQNNTEDLIELRKNLTQMLFVEGNHMCPSCEKSGGCDLQAMGYQLEMLDDHFPLFYPNREIDASHPDILLDRNRCIYCELCVRASREKDGKDVFAIGGRGIQSHLIVNSESGLLKDTNLDVNDQAAHVCPVGAIIVKRHGFETPIGERLYDFHTLGERSLEMGAEHGE